jgi:aspartate aminotransferase-like enzyme
MAEKKLIMVPGPTNIHDRVMKAMIKPMINHRGPEFRALFDSLTENMKYVFQTANDVYALTVSGTGGVECVIGNSVNPGDKVIVPVFGLFSERLKEAVVRRGGCPVELPLQWGTVPTANQIQKLVRQEKDAKAIAVVYNETSTGATVRELPEIGKIAQENDLLFIVDAVSILGGDELPVDKWGVDICVTASQKCLACPPGLALFSASPKAWKTIERVEKTFYFDMVEMREFSQKKETPFTPSVPLFFALDEALKMIREEGLENRFRRHKTCSEAFYDAVEAIGLTVFPEKQSRSHTVIAFNTPDGINGSEARKIMNEKYNVAVSGGTGKFKESMFRIGCMGIISDTEVLLTVKALEKALAELGYKPASGAGTKVARRQFRH